MKKNSKLKTIKDLLKVHHKVSRDIELEDQIGWKSKHKIVKSKKQYSRKLKHKGDYL